MYRILLDQELIATLESWIWPFFRIAGFLMTVPVIGRPVLIEPFSLAGFLTSAQQVVIGIALGLCLRVIFVVLELAGQIISQLMGLMMASMVDPTSDNRVPIIGQFYMLLAIFLFLGMDGHLLMLQSLADSFQKLPVGSAGISRNAVWTFLTWSGGILQTAVVIALPAITSLLIVNLAFGVMTKAAPQMNIFAVGFPVMIILGILIITLTLNGFIPHLRDLFEDAFVMMNSLVQD